MTMVVPDFRSASFLRKHARECLAFYSRPACRDAVSGGIFHNYKDDGAVFNARLRHLVSSTRFVVQFGWAMQQFPEERALWQPLLDTTLDFLRTKHRNPATGGYAWTLDVSPEGAVAATDAANHCYGLAFVTLAYATAFKAGVAAAKPWLDETFELMTSKFWLPEHGLYADEASADWATVSPYRGQNSNMHACEAHIAAYEATGEARHLERARTIAFSMCVRQAGRVRAATGYELVYEHYTPDWAAPDLEYNRDNPKHVFRPWGFQPGHMLEWAKLLLTLHRLRSAPGAEEAIEASGWRVPVARRFFSAAVLRGWDAAAPGGGLVYCVGASAGMPQIDRDKYFWVVAEGIAAAALLAEEAEASEAAAVPRAAAGSSDGDADGDGTADFYWHWYLLQWAYAWERLVDHQHGAWFRILSPDNAKVTDEKSPAGKTEYHVNGMVYDVLASLSRRAAEAPTPSPAAV